MLHHASQRRLEAAAATLLFCCCCLLAPGGALAARSYSTGDLLIGGGTPSIDARAQWASMPPDCAASATADFPARLALPQWDARSSNGARAFTGPWLRVYPGPPTVRTHESYRAK